MGCKETHESARETLQNFRKCTELLGQSTIPSGCTRSPSMTSHSNPVAVAGSQIGASVGAAFGAAASAGIAAVADAAGGVRTSVDRHAHRASAQTAIRSTPE